jgi:hypothetical protein
VRDFRDALTCNFAAFPKENSNRSTADRVASLTAISKYRQNAFAILICSGVLHSGSNSAGEHTKILNAFAREVATFNRFKE